MTRPASDEAIEMVLDRSWKHAKQYGGEWWGNDLTLRSFASRVRAEREGRLRAEAQVRALKEALGEALEASREPAAEKALAEITSYIDDCFDIRVVYQTVLRRIMADHGFGGGS